MGIGGGKGESEARKHRIPINRIATSQTQHPIEQKDQDEANELCKVLIVASTIKSGIGLPHSKTSRMEWHARTSRQRRGVRQPYAAFRSRVRCQTLTFIRGSRVY